VLLYRPPTSRPAGIVKKGTINGGVPAMMLA
jgi:hypothetical protein